MVVSAAAWGCRAGEDRSRAAMGHLFSSVCRPQLEMLACKT